MSSTIGVQACGPDFSEHKKTIMEGEYTEAWLKNPHRELLLIGWRKLKLKRGGKAMRWRPRIGEFQLKYGKLIFYEWEQPRTDAEKE